MQQHYLTSNVWPTPRKSGIDVSSAMLDDTTKIGDTTKQDDTKIEIETVNEVQSWAHKKETEQSGFNTNLNTPSSRSISPPNADIEETKIEFKVTTVMSP